MKRVLFFFSCLADADMDWLAATGTRRNYAKDAVLIRENSPLEEIFILLTGRLQVATEVNGADRRVTTIGSGEIVGELSFLDSRPPNASISALEDSVVLAIPKHLLSDRLAVDYAFAARFYHALGVFLAHRLRATMKYFGFQDSPAVAVEDEGELAPELLATVEYGAARFSRLLKAFSL